jgi:hypothetical protein
MADALTSNVCPEPANCPPLSAHGRKGHSQVAPRTTLSALSTLFVASPSANAAASPSYRLSFKLPSPAFPTVRIFFFQRPRLFVFCIVVAPLPSHVDALPR